MSNAKSLCIIPKREPEAADLGKIDTPSTGSRGLLGPTDLRHSSLEIIDGFANLSVLRHLPHGVRQEDFAEVRHNSEDGIMRKAVGGVILGDLIFVDVMIRIHEDHTKEVLGVRDL